MQTDAIEGDAETLRGKTVIEAEGAGGLDGCVEGVGEAPDGEDLVGAEEERKRRRLGVVVLRLLGEGNVSVWTGERGGRDLRGGGDGEVGCWAGVLEGG